jgi:6-pyruvoyltetrahydropterin/6-carboxytetrahydropterin synthase
VYKIKIIASFAAAHNLRNYNGKCESLHGHNYSVEVILAGDKLNENGLFIDFSEVKKSLNEILSVLDHTYLNELPHFIKENPSSENIAKFIYTEMQKIYHEKMDSVTVWESPTSAASYSLNYF